MLRERLGKCKYLITFQIACCYLWFLSFNRCSLKVIALHGPKMSSVIAALALLGYLKVYEKMYDCYSVKAFHHAIT